MCILIKYRATCKHCEQPWPGSKEWEKIEYCRTAYAHWDKTLDNEPTECDEWEEVREEDIKGNDCCDECDCPPTPALTPGGSSDDE
ncbi:hypothetical protein OC846_004624 [Tilletia horrida]|uniref:Uncharacterized protein n=1 Tax=Tilletia horrida TaxID=155126 RepID=A0AAN6JSL5_9BASI|nr:hypothetical protein OC846_004624 [Tilletia horrida]KAK0563454.1 hypothetical protein OC861_004783 [Tilletia horrida]